MAGFFGLFDYNRPGPGVPEPEDAPKKARPLVFLEIFSRKFWNLIKLNMMFLIFNIPALIAMMLVSEFFIQKQVLNTDLEQLYLKFVLGAVFLCLSVVTVGPAQAGFSYVLRNYAREEHAFLWGDFKEHSLKNFKQGLIVSLIDLVVIVLAGIDLNLYFTMKGNLFLNIAGGFMVMALVIFLCMHFYIYPMLVTFHLSIKQLYKNAFLFAIIRLLPNIGILILVVALMYAAFLIPLVGILLFVLILPATIGLLTTFYAYPTIRKHMMAGLDDRTGRPMEDVEKERDEMRL